MANRSAMGRGSIVEFKEATDEEALEFLKDRLGEAKFNEKKNELIDLVQNYTGGRFEYLMLVISGIKDLKGLSHRFTLLPYNFIVCVEIEIKARLRSLAADVYLRPSIDYYLTNERLKQIAEDKSVRIEIRKECRKALLMRDIANHIVAHGKIERINFIGIVDEEELSKAEMFTYHSATDSYAFASRAIETMYKVSHLFSIVFDVVLFKY